MIASKSSPFKLASWKLENAEIDAFCEVDGVSFQITGDHSTVTELALQKVRGWIHPEDVLWDTDLRTFYQLFQPVLLNKTEPVLSLIDREIVVGGKNLIRMVVSIENRRPHLRIQSEETIHSIPIENITGLANDVFQQIEGKVTPNVMERISRLADYGIVSIDLGQKKVKFGVTPIYFTSWISQEITPLKVELSNTIDQIVQSLFHAGYSHKEEFYLLHEKQLQTSQKSPLERERTLKEYRIGYGSLFRLKQKEFQIRVMNSNGKTITLRVTNGTYISKIQEKIQKLDGISFVMRRLLFGGTRLVCNATIGDYEIEEDDILDLTTSHAGGGCRSTSFADLRRKNQIIISFDDNAPAWRHVSPGLNLEGTCTTANCLANGQKVWVQKRFGRFNINKLANEFKGDQPKESRECVCPLCKETVSYIENCGFFNCIFSISGETTSNKIIKYSNQKAPEDKLLSFHSLSVRNSLFQYRHLTITTTPFIPSPPQLNLSIIIKKQESECIIL